MASTPGPVLPPSSQELCSGLPLCPLSREEGQHSWVAGVLFEGKVRCRGAQPCLSPEILAWGSFSLCMPYARLSQD